MSNFRSPNFVSLFSGCGGLDLGFVQAGFRCISAIDSDAHAVAVHSKNLTGRAALGDLSEPFSLPHEWRKTDVLLAGPPCQGFSTVGKRRLDDPRNSLIITAAQIAAQLRPRVVVIENVAGVIAGNHKQFWEKAVATLRAAKYHVAELRCDATDFGVFQNRRRLVMLAWQTAYVGEVKLTRVAGSNLRAALAIEKGTPNHEVHPLALTCRAGKIARRIGQGQKLCNVRLSPRAVHTWQIPEVFGKTTQFERDVLIALLRRRRQERVRDYGDADPVTAHALLSYVGRPVASTLRALQAKGYVRKIDSLYDLSHTFNGKFRRLDWDTPAPTVDTKYGDPHYFLHPEQPRAFSVREAARIQGFPDTFCFEGPEKLQFQMVGNAVPPPMANSLANFIKSRLLQS